MNRPLFKKVIIVFTETNQGEDYRDFLKTAMAPDDVTFIDIQPVPPGEDWRNVAVNKGLESSDAEWVWFTEQDFISMPQYWIALKSVVMNKRADIAAIYDQERMHPCSILVTRKLVDKTTKNFGIVPNELDHFGMFQREIDFIGAKRALVGPFYYNHMNGLTHNMNLVYNGEEPNYKPEDFKKYLEICLEVDTVPQDERFVALAKGYLQK